MPRSSPTAAALPARRATVMESSATQMAESGSDYFVGQFSFGDLTLKETLRSIELFAGEVMPALRPL